MRTCVPHYAKVQIGFGPDPNFSWMANISLGGTKADGDKGQTNQKQIWESCGNKLILYLCCRKGLQCTSRKTQA